MPPQPPSSAAPARRTLPRVLFTAFEPSGDDHASAVIAELKRRHPALPIVAWGGPRMAAAGAQVIERTGQDAVMGVPGVKKVAEHLAINRRIRDYLVEMRDRGEPIALHVPVDSPAANTPICKISKAAGCKVLHLVAPQIWAWGRWRVDTLRKVTDRVLCVLPFEEEFFRARNVPARFIGHFLFDRELSMPELDRRGLAFGDGHPRIAMFAGSRPSELRKHVPLLVDAFVRVREKFPNASGVMAAPGDDAARMIRDDDVLEGRTFPEQVRVVTGDTDAVVRWCDVALVKSGTVTLQVAQQHKPMVVFYKKSNPVSFLIARTVLSTQMFSLPNLLAGRRIVPELVPHFGGPAPIADLAIRLLEDEAFRQRQVDDLRAVSAIYAGRHAARAAADEIEQMVGLTPAQQSAGVGAGVGVGVS